MPGSVDTILDYYTLRDADVLRAAFAVGDFRTFGLGGGGPTGCTGTWIGPNTVLTARHCGDIRRGRANSFSLEGHPGRTQLNHRPSTRRYACDEQTLTGSASHFDFAIWTCLPAVAGDLPGGIRYGYLPYEPRPLSVGDEVYSVWRNGLTTDPNGLHQGRVSLFSSGAVTQTGMSNSPVGPNFLGCQEDPKGGDGYTAGFSTWFSVYNNRGASGSAHISRHRGSIVGGPTGTGFLEARGRRAVSIATAMGRELPEGERALVETGVRRNDPDLRFVPFRLAWIDEQGERREMVTRCLDPTRLQGLSEADADGDDVFDAQTEREAGLGSPLLSAYRIGFSNGLDRSALTVSALPEHLRVRLEREIFGSTRPLWNGIQVSLKGLTVRERFEGLRHPLSPVPFSADRPGHRSALLFDGQTITTAVLPLDEGEHHVSVQLAREEPLSPLFSLGRDEKDALRVQVTCESGASTEIDVPTRPPANARDETSWSVTRTLSLPCARPRLTVEPDLSEGDYVLLDGISLRRSDAVMRFETRHERDGWRGSHLSPYAVFSADGRTPADDAEPAEQGAYALNVLPDAPSSLDGFALLPSSRYAVTFFARTLNGERAELTTRLGEGSAPGNVEAVNGNWRRIRVDATSGRSGGILAFSVPAATNGEIVLVDDLALEPVPYLPREPLVPRIDDAVIVDPSILSPGVRRLDGQD